MKLQGFMNLMEIFHYISKFLSKNKIFIGSVCKVLCSRVILNPFHATRLFLYPLETCFQGV